MLPVDFHDLWFTRGLCEPDLLQEKGASQSIQGLIPRRSWRKSLRGGRNCWAFCGLRSAGLVSAEQSCLGSHPAACPEHTHWWRRENPGRVGCGS